MTAPFARWRDQYRDRPGQLPTREVLAALDAATVVGVRADILLQLVVQAENHEAWTTMAGAPLHRLSIVGNECVHCGTVMGSGLKCTGCGWVDPMTRSAR